MDRSDQALRAWLQGRAGEWKRLEALLKAQRGRRADDSDELQDLVRKFRALAHDLSLARALLPGSRITRYLEQLFGHGHEIIYRTPQRLWARLKVMMRDEVPLVVQALRGDIAATVSLFLGTGVAGWLLVHNFPELASLFASEGMIESVERGELWTDGILNIMPSAVMSLRIMTNNIMVTLFAFTLGALYGLGTLYIIGLNGLMLGGVFAFTGQHGLDGRLFNFIIAHGVVELSVICLAGAAGIRLGEALIRPGARGRGEAFRHAVAQAGTLLPLCALFLVGAGLIEGYVSPNDDYPLSLRLIIGLSYGVLLWGALSGRLWRLGRR